MSKTILNFEIKFEKNTNVFCYFLDQNLNDWFENKTFVKKINVQICDKTFVQLFF